MGGWVGGCGGGRGIQSAPTHLTARCCFGLASSDAPTVHNGSTARGMLGWKGRMPLCEAMPRLMSLSST